jgi:hypothetical protein
VSLSVCCATRDPGPQVYAGLAPLRAVADEIVIVADDRTTAEDLAWYAACADRLFTFEFVDAVERIRSWMYAHCSCEWILLMDGDECASPDLIARLPELTAQRLINQFCVPRRWLYPDRDHWLDEAPWWPDVSNRLVRNDGALFSLDINHTNPLRVDPIGFLEEPIYHFATLLPLDQRQAKIERHRITTAELRIAGGSRLVNETYYLPEQTSKRPPARVPDADREAIARFINANMALPPARASEVVHAPLEETDRFFAGRTFDPGGYRVRLELRERDLRIPRGELRYMFVRVTNEGTERWPWGLERPPHVHLAYQLWDRASQQWVDPEVTTPLPHSFEPGTRALVSVTIIAPEQPGTYRVRVDMRHAGHRWFGEPLEFEVEVY